MSPEYSAPALPINPYFGFIHDGDTPGQPVLRPGSMGALLLELAPMESIMPLLKPLGLGLGSMTFDEISLLAMQALDAIGNRYAVRYLIQLTPDHAGRVDLPDNCHSVDAVVAGTLHANRGSAATTLDERLWAASQCFRRGSACVTYPTTPFQGDLWGRPIPTALSIGAGASTLLVEAGTGPILLSYRARYVDDAGWPLITPKQALACAYYCRYVVASERYFARQLGGDAYDRAKSAWEESIGPAKNEGLGDKQGVARLLDAKTSYHRHSYGSSIKL